MIGSTHFYHAHSRKAIVAFGSIFTGLTVKRQDEEGGNLQLLKVPVTFVPNNKSVLRVLTAPELIGNRSKIQINLPMISYEVTSFTYDSDRKLQTMRNVVMKDAKGDVTATLVPVPYALDFTVSIWTKNLDDGLQIVEQIIPFFTPKLNVTINDLPGMDIKHDLSIELMGVEQNVSFEGSKDEPTILTWDLTFRVLMNYYGNIARRELIKQVIIDIFANDGPEGIRQTTTAIDGYDESSIWADTLFAEMFWSEGMFGGEGQMILATNPEQYEVVQTTEDLE